MKLSDLSYETYSSLSSNKARSFLTMLGIVIGISSVIALVSVGQGATASVTSNISSLGSNLLLIYPGSSRNSGPVSGGAGSAQTLTLDDAKAIKSDISGVSAVAAELSRRYQVTYKSNNSNSQVVGTEQSYAQIRNIETSSGYFISDDQVKSFSKVAVIGPTIQEELFGAGVDPVGQTIKINQIQFKVVGLTTSKGGTGFNNSDNSIYVPISTAQRFLAGRSSISDINVQAASQEQISTAQEEITQLLLSRHNISDAASADFSITNQADIVSSLSSITGTLTLLLGAIAGISLLVGGIGIMNMMLTTVTERTREIGLRKAIGAKRTDITAQFLSESVALTFVGGIIGIILGIAISILISKFGSFNTAITWQSILLAFGVSALVGIVFGYYPARRAAKLNPIEALRYE